MKVEITVIIPTYKPKDYLWECLDSLVAQTLDRTKFEVLMVLNGCKEPYETQIREYLSKHHELNVNLMQTDQGGVSNARNIALDRAQGEYVTFIDDDDYVSPAYLEELLAKAAPDTISLCYPYAFNDGEPEKQLKYKITDAYNKLARYGKQNYLRSRKFFSGPCMKLIPMSFIQGRRFDVCFANGEDSLFMFLISDKFVFVDYCSETAVYYRRYRENSAVTTKYTLTYILRNHIHLLSAYTLIYFSGPLKYSLKFYLLRIGAMFHNLFACLHICH